MSTHQVLRVPADMDEDIAIVDLAPGLKGMRDLFGSQDVTVQAVSLGVGDGLVLLDEDGKTKRLPRNQRATDLMVNAGLHPADFISGDMFIVGSAGSEFDSVSPDVVKFVNKRMLTEITV